MKKLNPSATSSGEPPSATNRHIIRIAIIAGGLLAVFGWAWFQIDSLNQYKQQSEADKKSVAATMQAIRGELNETQIQAGARATEIADLKSQLQRASDSVKARTENLSFVSDLDGTSQNYLLITSETLPAGPLPLIVYLHSMGNGADEILKWRANQESLVTFLIRRGAIIASPRYRGDSWLNPAATADVVQVIRLLKKRFPVSATIVSGHSMGGTAAVMFPIVAPTDVSVSGIVAAAFGSDVTDLWSETKNAQVKESLRIAYGGSPTEQPQIYAERALLRNIIRLPASIPIALYATYTDSMIPTDQQIRLRDALSLRGNPMLFAEIPGNHQVDGLDEGFAFVLNRLAIK